MSEKTQIVGKPTAQAFYQVLRHHLKQKQGGQQIITAFEIDPDKGSKALADYLRRQLPQDEQLANQLTQALGGGGQFATIVTGGQVDEIINIARLGVLNLTIRRYLYVFRDVRQLLVFLAVVVLGITAVIYLRWLSNQPAVMTGDFNIAVAQFTEEPASANPITAPIVSQMLFNFLENEYQLSGLGNVQVAQDKIGVVTEANEAKELAETINADLVVYGDVTVTNGTALVYPKFYVVESLHSDVSEVNGQHQLALPTAFPLEELADYQNPENVALRQRTAILTEFTKGLAYLNTGDVPQALEAIQKTIHYSETYEDFEGKEVLYLFASHIERLMGNYEAAITYAETALTLNTSYARAYIALANIYYDQQDFDIALTYYEQAKNAENQPDGAYIPQKANLGIGNIYNYQYQIAEPAAKPGLAEQALNHFQAVITAYEDDPDADFRLREMAAWAYYGIGIIYQREGQDDEAQKVFEQALALTQDAELEERAQNRLDEVR